MKNLKALKTLYDKLGNDSVRSTVLTAAEHFGIRKDIIRMDTNNFCNVRCIMCDRISTSTEKHFMSLSEFQSILNRFASTTRMLYLSCACEPLVTPHFTEYLRYAKKKGIPHISFCTNALLLNEDISAFLVDYEIDEIIVSFNGFSGEDYERIMPGSDYERVIANLAYLKQYKDTRHAVKPHIRLNTVLLKSNIINGQEIISFASQYGIDTVQLRECMVMDSQNDPAEVQKELLSDLSPEEYHTIYVKLQKITAGLRSMGTEVILPSFLEDNSLKETFIEKASIEDTSEEGNLTEKDIPAATLSKAAGNSKRSCSIPFFSYWIDWSGTVRICGYDQNGIIGNALSQDYKELRQKRKAFQRLSLAGECSRELCTMNMESSRFRS